MLWLQVRWRIATAWLINAAIRRVLTPALNYLLSLQRNNALAANGIIGKARMRLATCELCPKYRSSVCNECHCFMPLKVQIPGAKCPIGRW